jgi:hypothetical protein
MEIIGWQMGKSSGEQNNRQIGLIQQSFGVKSEMINVGLLNKVFSNL